MALSCASNGPLLALSMALGVGGTPLTRSVGTSALQKSAALMLLATANAWRVPASSPPGVTRRALHDYTESSATTLSDSDSRTGDRSCNACTETCDVTHQTEEGCCGCDNSVCTFGCVAGCDCDCVVDTHETGACNTGEHAAPCHQLLLFNA